MATAPARTPARGPEDTTALAKRVEPIEQLVERYGVQAIQALPAFQRALTLARGIQLLRAAMTPEIIAEIMPLQGTRLGFRTDRDDKGGYVPDVVREVAIQALLHGLHFSGNEFNIIAGNLYATKEGYERKVRELPGLTDLKLVPGVPAVKDGGCVVPYLASWRLWGEPGNVELKIPIRVVGSQGIDAILGKAKRKILAWIYSYVTGSEHSALGDADEEGGEILEHKPDRPALSAGTPPATRSEQVRDKLAAKPNGDVKPLTPGPSPAKPGDGADDDPTPPDERPGNGKLFDPAGAGPYGDRA